MVDKEKTIVDVFKWSYDHQDLFYLPQWQTGSRIDEFYVIYKLAYVSFYIVVTVIAVDRDIPLSLQLYAACYYTCWHFFMCMGYSVLSAICVFKEYVKQKQLGIKDEDVIEMEHSVFYKIQWIVLSVVTDSSVAVSVGYFTLVHSRGYPYFAKTAIMHLWVPILAVMDFMISSVPAKLLHGHVSLVVAIVYASFTYVYYSCGGRSIYGDHYLYEVLNYKDSPGLAVVALMSCLVCMMLGRGVVYFLFRLRHKIFWKYYVLTTNPHEVTRFVYEIKK